MNEESAFWQAIEANPDDRFTMLVFADWLADQGDERSMGIRAIGQGEYKCQQYDPEWYWGTQDNAIYCSPKDTLDGLRIYNILLPQDWFVGLQEGDRHDRQYWRYYKSNREALNDAALAFAKLPYDRQQELLHQQESVHVANC